MAYTKADILRCLDELAMDISHLYQSERLNYRGKTSDTKEYFTEVIAEWALEHLDLLSQIKPITRRASYMVEGHDGVTDAPVSNREEELIAMSMKRQGALPLVGQVLDYQVPLKNKKDDKAGKIDLLAYDGTTLRILELKEPDSKETMLRCVLEGYTYLKTVDQAKLLADFGLPSHTKVVACPFVFREGAQWQELQQGRPWLKRLMEHLDSKPFYVMKENDKYIVVEE